MANENHPEWCNYKIGVDGRIGCYSFLYAKVSPQICKPCHLFNASAPNKACTGLAEVSAVTSISMHEVDSIGGQYLLFPANQ